MENPSKKHVYLKLFTSTFYLSAMTFGGGYVIIPLLHRKFVDNLKWISEEEMINLAAIAQSSPGAVAVNASILLGYQIAGLPGALITILGTVLPPLVILSVISLFYNAFRQNVVVNAVLKGMQAGIAAVIFDVVLNMGGTITKKKDWISILVMIAAFAATFFFKVNILIIILCCGVIGAARALIINRQKKQLGGDAK